MCRYLVGTIVCDANSAKAQWGAAKTELDQLRRYLFPWEERKKETEAQTLRQSWENIYGSMDDPEVQAAINRTAAAMQAQRSRRN